MKLKYNLLLYLNELFCITEVSSESNTWDLKNTDCYETQSIKGGVHKVFQIKKITHRTVDILPFSKLKMSIKIHPKVEIIDEKYFLRPLKESCPRNGVLQDKKVWGKMQDPLVNIWVEVNKEIQNLSKQQYSIKVKELVKDSNVLRILNSKSTIFIN